jgi:predicted metal-dependent phosphoesterase TrpH
MPYDLHNHSIVSKDGQTPARELIDIAAARGMKGLGICDHDELPDEALYEYAQHKGLKLALGTEFTCDDAHILGYNMGHIPPQDKAFLEDRFQKMRKDYVDMTKAMILQLQDIGIDVTYEQVLQKYDRPRASKLFVLKFLAEEMGLYPSWSEARKDLQKRINYKPDGTGVESLNPARAIDIIHNAGGYAIWAHPFIKSAERLDEYFELFARLDIDAVEANYAYRQNGYKGEETNDELDRIVRKRLFEKGIAVSGGSDSHYPVKTYSDLSPIMPGDFGITDEEFRNVSQMFR